jgi:hypothetical protein
MEASTYTLRTTKKIQKGQGGYIMALCDRQRRISRKVKEKASEQSATSKEWHWPSPGTDGENNPASSRRHRDTLMFFV